MQIFPTQESAGCGMEIANCISNYHAVFGNLHSLAVIIGGTFVLIALLLSTLLILQHLRSYTKPEEQKWVIGVLLMVPIYATESMISLWNGRFSIVCDILRNCYEAFALYCFGNYLVACLGKFFSPLFTSSKNATFDSRPC
ncbi:hypothetical protein Taro_020265 [Colocasia esculenta]|uniref:Uncharacterized protein n=1 Tax=Colocasia esculenta TaxID=4460 RepID=A0A843V4P3_COLES|nr:hypothetical protein [Colocasia esculenta]